MLYYLLLFSLSIIFSTVFILTFKKLFYKYKILDNPKKYKKNRAPIPYSMWVVFFLSFFIITFLFVEFDFRLHLIWLFWFFITLISFIDDRLNISAKFRLLIQILIWAVIWISSIKIWYISNVFWWIIDLEQFYITLYDYKIYLFSLFFTIFWYVFIFNALNWTDWIQWNTSGLSIISFFIIFLLWVYLYFTDDYEWWIQNAKFIMSLSIILVWILIPFFVFDIKEKILMWDSWTMFLWFMLATLAIIAWWKIATVLVVFGIYAVDAVYVILKRILRWANPLMWDFTHLHHRLLDLWMTKNQVLIFVFSFSFLFWLSALFMQTTWKIILFIIIIIFVIYSPKLISYYINKNN